jgi:hypothetical protein
MRPLTLCLAVLLAVAPAGGLDAAWDRFDDQIVDWPCLTVPRMRVVDWLPNGWWGSYTYGIVSVRRDAPSWAAIHEFAHHLFTVCRIDRRPIGARFLAAVHSPSWGPREREWFAATLTWMLTGKGRQDIRRQAAWTLEPLMGN